MSYEKLEVTKGLMEAYVAMNAPQQQEIVEEVEDLNEGPPASAMTGFNPNNSPNNNPLTAYSRSKSKDYERRGGDLGALGRTLKRGWEGSFGAGSTPETKKWDAEDKADEARARQAQASASGRYYSSSDEKIYRNYNDALAARNSRLKALGKTPPGAGGGAADAGGGSGAGGGRNTPPVSAKVPPASSTVLAKQGGVEGKLDKATGKFTAGAFSDTEKSRYASVAAKNAPRPGTQAAGPESIRPKTPNPLLKDNEIARMRSASVMRQNNMSLPGAANPTSADIKKSQDDAAAARVKSAGTAAAATPTTNQTTTAFKAPALSSSTPEIKSAGTAAATAAASNLKAPDIVTAFSQKTAATSAPVTANPSADEKKKQTQVSHTDLFDLVKGHLLDEGYAETEEAALKIMANMGEEWRQEILDEAKYGTKAGRKRLAKKIRKGENIGKKGPGTGFKAVEKAAEKGGAEDPAAVAAAQMWKSHGK